ncbi:MAG TPA: methyltransferase domain-containing protein [Thermoanaerobaculia bacterium]|jgi:SAM-dependent methyltransferase
MAGHAQDAKGNVYRFESDWIHELESEITWRRYWHQQKLLNGVLKPGASILELGPGTGFTAQYLRSRGFTVTTLDIDPDKKPDIVANLADYEFPKRYDCIIAFEIMEHVPFDVVRSMLPRAAAACDAFVFSVPQMVRTWLDVSVKVPRFRELSLRLSTPRRGNLTPNHHWELGPHSVPERKLRELLEASGLKVERTSTFKHWTFYITRPR